MDKPKPCPLCGKEMVRSNLFETWLWAHSDGECILDVIVLSDDEIPAWNRRAPVEWTVTRSHAEDAANRFIDDAFRSDERGMNATRALVEALGGKVEG